MAEILTDLSTSTLVRALWLKVGVLQSSALGYKVSQRLGFKEVYRMSHYAWQAKE